jgi:hypothetical protein
VKDHPDRVRLVQADLEEVVPASQRAELGQGLADLLVGEDAVRTVGCQPPFGPGKRLGVAFADA